MPRWHPRDWWRPAARDAQTAPSSPLVPSGAGSGQGYVSRPSPGLEQFFASLPQEAALSLLDFSGASQANIQHITGLGYRLYSEDLLAALDTLFPDGDQTAPERVHEFLAVHLDFRDFDHDGALLWDLLQFLSPSLLPVVVERLYRTLRPDAPVYALFHADERHPVVPAHHFRIVDGRTVAVLPRPHAQPCQPFNNRAIERLFQRFASVKFFLTRDNLREVVVRR